MIRHALRYFYGIIMRSVKRRGLHTHDMWKCTQERITRRVCLSKTVQLQVKGCSQMMSFSIYPVVRTNNGMPTAFFNTLVLNVYIIRIHVHTRTTPSVWYWHWLQKIAVITILRDEHARIHVYDDDVLLIATQAEKRKTHKLQWICDFHALFRCI